MFVIWKGWGVVVPFIVIATVVLVRLFLGLFFEDAFFEEHLNLIAGISLVLSAILVFISGYLMNSVEKEDDKEESEIVNKHTLFFIPVQHWSYIIIIFTIWMIFFAE